MLSNMGPRFSSSHLYYIPLHVFVHFIFLSFIFFFSSFFPFPAGYIPSAGIPLQKQLEHANQQSGFTDSVSRTSGNTLWTRNGKSAALNGLHVSLVNVFAHVFFRVLWGPCIPRLYMSVLQVCCPPPPLLSKSLLARLEIHFYSFKT